MQEEIWFGKSQGGEVTGLGTGRSTYKLPSCFTCPLLPLLPYLHVNGQVVLQCVDRVLGLLVGLGTLNMRRGKGSESPERLGYNCR